MLCVVVFEDYLFFGLVGMDMQLQGYDIDMVGFFVKVFGVKLKLVFVNSVNWILYLMINKVDMVILLFGKILECEKVIDFLSVYVLYFQGVFGLFDVKVSVLVDFIGKMVGVMCGVFEEIVLLQFVLNVMIKCFEDNNVMIQVFLLGQVQLIVVGNIVVVVIFVKNLLCCFEVKFVIKNLLCFVGVNKNELCLFVKIDDVIVYVKQDGLLGEMLCKWFGQLLLVGL